MTQLYVGCAILKSFRINQFNQTKESGGIMITLKKSFEVQNYLSKLLAEALEILSYNDNITTTKQTHLRNKSYSEAQDEEITVKKSNELPFTIDNLVTFIDLLIAEIDKLTIAINDAKNYKGQYLDAMIAMNNKRRNVLHAYERMAKLKQTERVVKGTAEKFNEAGEQVTYKYDINETTSIDYDRDRIKNRVSSLRRQLDRVSTAIDEMQLSSMVVYDPIFEVGESLEDAVEQCCC